jgi:CRP-like cAMP-binding protein
MALSPAMDVPMSRAAEPLLDLREVLSRLPLFQQLDDVRMARIVEHVRERRLGKGEMLFHKGDQPRGFYVVVFGQIKLAFPSSVGNEKVVDLLGAKQSFGEAVMFMGRPYPVFAEALCDTLVVHVGKDIIDELIRSDPDFANLLLAGLSVRLHGLLQDVELYSQHSSTQRVIGYLLQQAPDDGEVNEFRVELPTTKQIIASRLNVVPETLSRIFHDLSEAGLISVQGKRITVNDARRLREYNL